MIWCKQLSGAMKRWPARELFTCSTVPGDWWSAAWDDHAKYFAVKLGANMAKVGVVPK